MSSTQSSPKVTVLMSVYNADKYIRESIESILNQTFTDFEFLIFDDGSTDGTVQILREFEGKDKRIKAFYKEKNEGMQGMMKNLNMGMEIAQGKYIARMDGDDISLPERLQAQVNFLDSNSEIFLVGTGAINIDDNGKVQSVFKPVTSPEALAEKLIKVPSIYNPTVMFRSGSDIRYVPLKAAEDYDLFLQALKKGLKLSNIATPLLHYRVLPPSLSHSDPFLRSMNTVAAQEKYLGNLKSEELTEEIISERYHPSRCSKDILMRMVETAYLGRSYDALFKLASIYTTRFGVNLKIMIWEGVSGLKLAIKTIL